MSVTFLLKKQHSLYFVMVDSKKTFNLCLCLCRSLEQEQSLRRKAELESAEYKLKLQVVTNKYGQVQQELQVSASAVYNLF